LKQKTRSLMNKIFLAPGVRQVELQRRNTTPRWRAVAEFKDEEIIIDGHSPKIVLTFLLKRVTGEIS
jgi:hypothetical protein